MNILNNKVHRWFIAAVLLLLRTQGFGGEPAMKSIPVKSTISFDKEYHDPKLALGICVGNTTGLSLIGGWYSDPFAVRVSSGFDLSGWHGVQGDVSYMVMRYSQSRHDVAMIGGVFRYEDETSPGVTKEGSEHFIGSAYTVFYRGFHFQLGAAYGIEDYSHYILIFQAGYMLTIM